MKFLIVYGSLLGKTARLSELAGSIIKKYEHSVTVKDVRSTTVVELNGYDVIILASSTWDDGQLQFDYRPFNTALLKSNFAGKKFAIIGVGGHKYPHPFYAADILESTVEKISGTLIYEPLKLDLDHDEADDKCDEELTDWVEHLLTKLS